MFADDDEESDEASVAKVSPLSMTAAIMLLLLLSVFMNAKAKACFPHGSLCLCNDGTVW